LRSRQASWGDQCQGRSACGAEGARSLESFRAEIEVRLAPEESKSDAGRKPFDAVLMFKILVLQTLYNLSDEQVEYQIRDRISFMRFLGLGLEDAVPDAGFPHLHEFRLREHACARAILVTRANVHGRVNVAIPRSIAHAKNAESAVRRLPPCHCCAQGHRLRARHRRACAGKRRSTRIRKGSPWLKSTLVQCAWAAIRTKGS